MHTMQTTSRTAALDYLLAIGNLIALADHKEEQIMNLLEEHESISSDSTPEEISALQESIRQEIVQTSKDRDELYNLRKDLQRNFFERYNIDQDYWCQFKHFAVALTAAEECRNADPTFQNDQLVIKLRTLVYRFLGTILGVGPANCGRCLADAWGSHNAIPELPDAYKGPFFVKHDNGGIFSRVYKMKNLEESLGDWTVVSKIADKYGVVCKDLSTEKTQLLPSEGTFIDADILEPTPIEQPHHSVNELFSLLDGYCNTHDDTQASYLYEIHTIDNLVKIYTKGIDEKFIEDNFTIHSRGTTNADYPNRYSIEVF